MVSTVGLEGINEAWYSLLDSLDAKGIPVYKVIDPIENAGIPSLFLFVGLALVFLLFLIYLLFPGGGPGGLVNVKFTGEDLQGASLTVYANGELFKTLKIEGNETELGIPPENVSVKVEKGECTFEKEFEKVTPGLIVPVKLLCPSVTGACLVTGTELTSTPIYTKPPLRRGKNCEIVVKDKDGKTIDLGWKISGSNILFSEAKDCPKAGLSVEITCNGASKEWDMGEFLPKVLNNRRIIIEKNNPERDSDNQAKIAEKVYSIYVDVVSENGEKLDGIEVTATNDLGLEVSLPYTNVVTKDYTNNGVAKLELPEGQEFYISASDPSGKWAPARLDEEFLANKPMQLNVTMVSGEKVVFSVVDNKTGDPLSTAQISVYKEDILVGTYFTQANGTITAKLEKGEYKALIRKPGYSMAKVEFSTGKKVEAKLEKLDDTNSGMLTAHIVNIENGKPISDISAILTTLEGDVYSQGVSDEEGIINFGRVYQGKYYIQVPALDNGLDTDFTSQEFEITPGSISDIDVEITPPSALVNVTALVNNETMQDVNIEVYSTDPADENPIWTGATDANGQVQFPVEKGKEIHIRAMYHGEKVYGPTITSPQRIDGPTQIEIKLQELTFNQTAYITRINGEKVELENGVYQLVEGDRAYVVFPVNLPYYQEGEPFDSVKLVAWIGDLNGGSVDSLPIVFGDIRASDFVTDWTTNVAIRKTTSVGTRGTVYSLGKDSDHTYSNYIEVEISNYTEGTYEIKIPLVSMPMDESSVVYIFYKTIWEKASEDVEIESSQLFDNLTIYATPPEFAWIIRDIGNNRFRAYRFMFSLDKDGLVPLTDLPTSTVFYLQLDLAAKRDVSNFDIGWDLLPDSHAFRSIYYDGFVYKTDGTEDKIYGESINSGFGSSGSIMISENGLKGVSINKGDIMHLSIKMEFRAGSDKDGEFYLFRDTDHKYGFNVSKAIEWLPTPVGNITGAYRIYSHVNGGWPSQEEPFPSMDKNGDPVNSYVFVKLENEGDNEADLNVSASGEGIEVTGVASGIANMPDKLESPNINFEEGSEKGITLESGGSEVVVFNVTGTGEEGYLEISINDQPWVRIQHGKVWYELGVTDGDGEEVNVGDGQLLIKAYRGEKELDISGTDIEVSGTSIGPGGVSKYLDTQNNQWIVTVLPADSGLLSGELIVRVSGDFGVIEKRIELGGLEFYPEVGTFEIPPEVAITVTDNTNENVGISAQWKDKDLSKFGIMVWPTSETIASGQPLDITVSGEPYGCFGTVSSILRIEGKANEELIGAKDYNVKIQCPGPNIPQLPNRILREGTDPQDMDLSSNEYCQPYDSYGFTRLCDADQFGAYLVGMAENDQPGSMRIVALGYEDLSWIDLKQVVEKISGSWLCVEDSTDENLKCGTGEMIHITSDSQRPGCGLVTLYYEGKDENTGSPRIKLTTQSQEWCDINKYMTLLPLLSYDGYSRLSAQVNSYGVVVDGDFEEFKEGMDTVVGQTVSDYQIKQGDLYSYLTVGSLPSEGKVTIMYKELPAEEAPIGAYELDTGNFTFNFNPDSGEANINLYCNQSDIEMCRKNLFKVLFSSTLQSQELEVYNHPPSVTISSTHFYRNGTLKIQVTISDPDEQKVTGVLNVLGMTLVCSNTMEKEKDMSSKSITKMCDLSSHIPKAEQDHCAGFGTGAQVTDELGKTAEASKDHIFCNHSPNCNSISVTRYLPGTSVITHPKIITQPMVFDPQASQGQCEITINATDPDRDKLTYQYDGQTGEITGNPFTISLQGECPDSVAVKDNWGGKCTFEVPGTGTTTTGGTITREGTTPSSGTTGGKTGLTVTKESLKQTKSALVNYAQRTGTKASTTKTKTLTTKTKTAKTSLRI